MGTRGASRLMTTTDNGVNVQALLDAREVLKGAPEAAQFKWRASSRWENGVDSTTQIPNFFGLGEGESPQNENQVTSHPPQGLPPPDNRNTPIRYPLLGLAGCLAAGGA